MPRAARSAARHCFDLPEVTFFAPPLVSVQIDTHHARMTTSRPRLFEPLNLVALATLAVVGYTMLRLEMPDRWYALLLVIAFGLLSVGMDLSPLDAHRSTTGFLLSFALGVLGILACWFGAGAGTVQILLVLWVARASYYWPQRTLLIAAVALNVAVYFILSARGVRQPLLVTLLYACFQAFAAFLSTYSRRLEEARDHLMQVNADLLATRALLAETTRSNERFRVARDLHDVAGHKLTALRLNLRALALARPDQPELAVAEQLSADLLSDIRGVVHTLRAQEGLDVAPALAALAAPYDRPRVRVEMGDHVHITDARQAEAIVRCVQEALTNAAKHGDADSLTVTLRCDTGRLQLAITDNGRVLQHWAPGHGLQGMQERVEEAGGEVSIRASADGGMHIAASFPA